MLSKNTWIVIIPLLASIFDGYCQDFTPPKRFDKKIRRDFYDGQITFTSGDNVSCPLQYDFESGVLYRKYGKETLPYTANTVLSFSFDEEGSRRIFHSLPYQENGTTQYRFFERLFEKNNVIVLSNYYVTYQQSRHVIYGPNGAMMATGGPGIDHYVTYPTQTRQTSYYPNEEIMSISGSGIDQKIFIVNGDYGMIPFLRNKASTGKNKMLGKERAAFNYRLMHDSIPESIFKTKFREVEAFRKENKLRYTKLPDLVKIVDYYSTIR